ncbi:MAG: hypothetical protein MI756_04405, partial [Chromatiales bacterium]|nr:hypothetical protein [Chromatiales bacterium]
MAIAILRLGLLLATLGSSWAMERESCADFDRDGEPGYTFADFGIGLPFWRAVDDGSPGNDLPDFNGDRIVDVRDLVRQASCSLIAPGLVGSYFGWQTGDPEQVLTFEDTQNPEFPPAVVKAIDRLE